ncbi:cullin binding [Rhizoctonia solani]|uniref:Defective in cullin neddylation protein n=1 Tax=Rhizoctonia solani TaxID=456999 RepID=A0A8H8T2N1_9AGAM|nr:cullin binding [Rhizoctonia solani]QRW26514.1 cullin binding [Rhizoctonia solani]
MSRVSSTQRDALVSQFQGITDASKEQALSALKKHNYRLDAAVDAYYQALTDAPPAQVSTQKLGALFDKYKDPDSANIGINGTIQWCEDLGVDPEDVSLLAVACELKSPTVGEWTKNGFIDDDPEKRNGPILLGGTEMTCTPPPHFEAKTKIPPRIFLQRNPVGYVCDTIDQMKTTIATLRTKLGNDPDYFSRVYTYTFTFAKAEGARSISIESAIAFWNLLLSVGLSGSALPKNGWTDEHTEWWFEFLKERGGKGVSKDTWAMLPEFIKVIDGKFENHDLEAAWPSTIDDFVEWAKEKTQAGQS